MSAARWLQEQLGRHTYRPGWRLSIQVDPPYDAVFMARFMVIDTYNPTGPEREIVHSERMPLFALGADTEDPEMFTQWLQRKLFEIERHESREWLRRDGAIFDDPHREQR